MKFELVVGEEKHSDKSFDKEMFAAVLSTAISMREKVHLVKTFVIHKQNTNVIIILVIKFLLPSSWAEKYFWKKGKTEKLVKFYTEHTISEKQFCS